MLIFDLREEAQLFSLFHGVAAASIALGALSVLPPPMRSRLPVALIEAAGPLTFVFLLATGLLGWMEYDERRQADVMVELCLSGGCEMAEGPVYEVEHVRQTSSGGRFTAPVRRGEFKIGDKLYFHYPRDGSNYSPANLLREGDRVRVYSNGDQLVLVEVCE